MSQKLGKFLLGLALVGTVAGIVISYLNKKDQAHTSTDCTDIPEDEDFDLDSDLKPISDREYVPLGTPKKI